VFPSDVRSDTNPPDSTVYTCEELVSKIYHEPPVVTPSLMRGQISTRNGD